MAKRSGAGTAPVVYVLKRFPRLSETFVLRELLELEARGERILIDALLPPEDGPRHPELAHLQAEVRYLPRRPRLRDPAVARVHARLAARRPLEWIGHAVRARRAGTWRRFLQAGLVAERVRRRRARHIHAHFATAAIEVGRDAAALAGVGVTVTAHAKDIFQRDNAALLPARLAGVKAVATVSEFNADHLRRVLPGIDVRHIPNGIPAAAAAPVPTDGPVLCVARLVPKKGVDVLIEAAASLPGTNFEIVGDGPQRDDLTALARERGVADRVRFTGSLPSSEVDDAFARCSAFVLPCRVAPDGDRDGMPTSMLEAMARAVPVISTDVAGVREVVIHEQTGLLVPPDDPRVLAEALARLAHEPGLARALGERGRALVTERFDPSRSGRLLQELFGSPRA